MDKKITYYLYQLCYKNKTMGKICNFLCRCLPIIVIILYSFIILNLFIQKDQRVISVILVPAGTLTLVTILRKAINRSRPFETITGLIPYIDHHNGESFPSRHTSSAFIIAFALSSVYQPVGIVCFILAFIIALTRVFTGLHYPSDILAGAGISICVGLIFFN